MNDLIADINSRLSKIKSRINKNENLQEDDLAFLLFANLMEEENNERRTQNNRTESIR